MKKLGDPPLSILQKTKIYFEYDMEWQKIHTQLRLRTIK